MVFYHDDQLHEDSLSKHKNERSIAKINWDQDLPDLTKQTNSDFDRSNDDDKVVNLSKDSHLTNEEFPNVVIRLDLANDK